MFEHHREHHEDAVRAAALHDWQVHHDAYAGMLDTARSFTGTTADGLLLAAGETSFLQVTDTELIEERRGKGTYVGHSQGISVPVTRIGGRQIRYRVGATKGHYVQGDMSPTAIDTGTTYITSTRVVFRGANQTRECAFAKLLGFDHDDDAGTTTLSVSNRTRPTTVRYGPACSATFDFRLDLALAHFRHTVDELVAGLEADLAAIDSARPTEAPPEGPVAPPPPGPDHRPPKPGTTSPTGTVPDSDPGPAPDPGSVVMAPSVPTPTTDGRPPPGAPVPPSAAQPTVAAAWYPDPWHDAPLRWWDGSAWSWRTVDPGGPPPDPA